MRCSAGKYVKGERPWNVDAKYDIALPCATQNEVHFYKRRPWIMLKNRTGRGVYVRI